MRISLTLNELILYFYFNLLETVYKNFDMKRWKKKYPFHLCCWQGVWGSTFFHPSKFYFVIGWSHPSTSNYLWPWNQLRAPCSKGQYVKPLLCFHIEAQIPYIKLIKFYFCFVIFLEYKWWKFTFFFSSMHIVTHIKGIFKVNSNQNLDLSCIFKRVRYIHVL